MRKGVGEGQLICGHGVSSVQIWFKTGRLYSENSCLRGGGHAYPPCPWHSSENEKLRSLLVATDPIFILLQHMH